MITEDRARTDNALADLAQAQKVLNERTAEARLASEAFKSRKDCCTPQEYTILDGRCRQAAEKLQSAMSSYEEIERQFGNRQWEQAQAAIAQTRTERRLKLNHELETINTEINRLIVFARSIPQQVDVLIATRNRCLMELAQLKEIN